MDPRRFRPELSESIASDWSNVPFGLPYKGYLNGPMAPRLTLVHGRLFPECSEENDLEPYSFPTPAPKALLASLFIRTFSLTWLDAMQHLSHSSAIPFRCNMLTLFF